ncbi:MAG: MerR family transcriptional regulator [Caryophanon sp.]|nr:MerR family transcriptional regulator [Caryophanon sp.]
MSEKWGSGMDNAGKLYTIGEIAKLTNLSIQTLRYYDKMELLKPALVDEATNYRYYTEAQMYYIDLIKSLKYIGTSLEDIKYAQSLTTEQLVAFLAQQENIVEQKLRKMKEVQQTLLKTKKQLEDQLNIPSFTEVYERQEEAERLLVVRANDLTPAYIPTSYFSSMLQTVERGGSVMNNRYGGIFALQPYDSLDVLHYDYLFTPLLTERYIEELNPGMDVMRMKAGRYVCIAFIFNAHTYLEEYERLYTYIKEHALVPLSDVYEFYMPMSYSPHEDTQYIVELKIKVD